MPGIRVVKVTPGRIVNGRFVPAAKKKNPASYAKAQRALFAAQKRALRADDAFQAALDKSGESRYSFHYKSKSVSAAKRRKIQADALVHRLTQKMRSLQ